MTQESIHDLLADAAIPPTPAPWFDAAAGLRRLAADAARPQPAPGLAQGRQARLLLVVMSRWVLTEPRDEAGPGSTAGDELIEVEEALVFACLLYLAGHPESAQFWWQLAGGAGDRVAAYCLHLHHAAQGEAREAQHWLDQTVSDLADPHEPVPQPVPLPDAHAYLALSKEAIRPGPTHAPYRVETALPEDSEQEPIVMRLDRELAARLHQLVDHR